jgi:hypothetical protein
LATLDPSFDQKNRPLQAAFISFMRREVSGSLLPPPSPPGEKAATRDQAWQASTSNGTRNRNTLDDNSEARIIKRFPIAEKVLQEGW